MNAQELDLHHARLPARHIQHSHLKTFAELLPMLIRPVGCHLCPFMSNSRFIYQELCRDRCDEAHQLITGDDPDAAVPLGRPVWRL